MNLDDDLRRLFTEQGDRLDVAIRPDAEQVIVAGAHRVRRRRRLTAGVSALAAVGVVAAGLALASGHQDAMPPAITITTTPPSTSADVTSAPPGTGSIGPAQPPADTATQTNTRTNEPPPADTETEGPTEPPALALPVLGPTGIRGAFLGQSLADAQATGLVGPLIQQSGGCDQYELLIDGLSPNYIYISAAGVQSFVSVNVQTPEGVGPGSPMAQVKAAYPELNVENATAYGEATVSVPGNAQATYWLIFTAENTIARVILQANGHACY